MSRSRPRRRWRSCRTGPGRPISLRDWSRAATHCCTASSLPTTSCWAGLPASVHEARQTAARRPVILVLALSLVFGLLHLLLVERPANRARRRRRAQAEFVDAMQVARSESEAYDLLAHHIERASDAVHVTVLNRNNSADRLEAVTPVEAGCPTAQGLEGAAPDSCLGYDWRARTTASPARTAAALRGVRLERRADEVRADRSSAVRSSARCSSSIPGRWAVSDARSSSIRSPRRRPVVANLRNLAVAELRAATDGLTGLANQRTVHETVKRVAAQAGRTASPLALVLFDLDHFKAVNDTYGHGKGDDVLAAVGAVAAGTVRASDFVGRFGGEEFAVVLPDTNRAGALDVAEKLRRQSRRSPSQASIAASPRRSGSRSCPTTPASPNCCSARPTGRSTPRRAQAATGWRRSTTHSPRRSQNPTPERRRADRRSHGCDA